MQRTQGAGIGCKSSKDLLRDGFVVLHELRGRRAGTGAVKVSGNWRITFVFRGKDAESVDYEDYH
jgi:proteic killer suppression protein